jgi:hypothetical protein
VPTKDERQGIIIAGSRGTDGTAMSNQLLLPMADTRNGYGQIISDNRYWSSNTTTSNETAYVLEFPQNSIVAQNASWHTEGNYVRCFKNDLTIASVTYSIPQSTWSTGSVTVTVTLDQPSLALGTDRGGSGTTFTKTYHTNTDENVTFTSIYGGTVTTKIEITSIDTQAPTVSFTPNGNETVATEHSTTVNVSDSGSIASPLYYQRSKKTTKPNTSTFT